MYIPFWIYLVGILFIAILFGVIIYFSDGSLEGDEGVIFLWTAIAIGWPGTVPMLFIFGLFYSIYYFLGGSDE